MPTFESVVGEGGWWPPPPHWIVVGGHSVRRPIQHTFVLFFTILKHISCLIHRILNERKTSHLGQDCLYLYKNKEIYMYCVLLVVLLDLWQGLIVLKSSLFSIIWQFVGHGGEHFCLGVLRGVMACGGDSTLWGCDPRMGVSWQLCYSFYCSWYKFWHQVRIKQIFMRTKRS